MPCHTIPYHTWMIGGAGWPSGGRSSWAKLIEINILLCETDDFSCLCFCIDKLIFTDHYFLIRRN